MEGYMQRTAIESMNGCKIKSGEKRRQVYSRHPPPQEVNPLTDLPRTALDLPIALKYPISGAPGGNRVQEVMSRQKPVGSLWRPQEMQVLHVRFGAGLAEIGFTFESSTSSSSTLRCSANGI